MQHQGTSKILCDHEVAMITIVTGSLVDMVIKDCINLNIAEQLC